MSRVDVFPNPKAEKELFLAMPVLENKLHWTCRTCFIAIGQLL
jgi:hypothetical protein